MERGSTNPGSRESDIGPVILVKQAAILTPNNILRESGVSTF